MRVCRFGHARTTKPPGSCENTKVMIAPSAVLLDLDGTLVDPAGAITSGIRHALTQAQIPDPGEENSCPSSDRH